VRKIYVLPEKAQKRRVFYGNENAAFAQRRLLSPTFILLQPERFRRQK